MAHGDPSIFTELLEILDEAVTIRDANGELIYANRAALRDMGFGSIEELRERPSSAIMADYIVEDEHGRPLKIEDVPSMRLMHSEPAEPLLMRVVNPRTGAVRWNLLKATPLRDEDGSYLGAMTVIENVTAVKNAEVRTGVLAESGRILASSLDYQETLRNVAHLAVPAIADWCAVDLVDANLRREHVVAAHRDPAKQQLAARIRESDPDELDPTHALGRVLLTGIAELHPEVTDEQLAEGARSEEHLRLLREIGMRSVAIVPMIVPTRAIGLMTLATAESRRRLTAEDVELAEQLARRAAVAVENARLHTTLTEVAQTLQQSLLPHELPEVPGWEVAAIYRPADTERRIDVGGDFYEVFNRDGRWYALIGDVTGKGVTAAALTSLMRHGARVASRLEPEPAEILHRLDEALRQQPGDALCTVLCVCLDGTEVTMSSAGHPPALLVSAQSGVRQAPKPGPLLGAFSDAQWSEQKLSIAADELLVLYTDGVIETPGVDERFGSERLRALLMEEAGSSPAQVLRRLEEALDAFRAGPGRDDMAVLALRPRR